MRCSPSRSLLALGIPLTFAVPGLSPADVLGALFGLILGFLQIIVGGIDSLVTNAFGGVDVSMALMFSGWGQALSVYGLWGPAITVMSIAVAGGVFYLLVGLVDAEKDADDAIEQV